MKIFKETRCCRCTGLKMHRDACRLAHIITLRMHCEWGLQDACTRWEIPEWSASCLEGEECCWSRPPGSAYRAAKSGASVLGGFLSWWWWWWWKWEWSSTSPSRPRLGRKSSISLPPWPTPPWWWKLSWREKIAGKMLNCCSDAAVTETVGVAADSPPPEQLLTLKSTLASSVAPERPDWCGKRGGPKLSRKIITNYHFSKATLRYGLT